MNFLQISLTNRCNLSCWHCPMGKWRNSPPPRWPLDNSILIPWMDKYIRPAKWVVELTGGEPALYPGLEELLSWLESHQYRVLIKTNGLLPILPHAGIKRVAALHQLGNPPKYFDEILIVDKLDREAKERWCTERGIPYKVIGIWKENPDNAGHGFTYCAYINNAGHQVGCQALSVRENIMDDGVDYNRITHRPLVMMQCCAKCKAAIDAWRFL